MSKNNLKKIEESVDRINDARKGFNDLMRNANDQMLVACIRHLCKKGELSSDENAVRAQLLGEYERRHGGDAVDQFMTELGLM